MDPPAEVDPGESCRSRDAGEDRPDTAQQEFGIEEGRGAKAVWWSTAGIWAEICMRRSYLLEKDAREEVDVMRTISYVMEGTLDLQTYAP